METQQNNGVHVQNGVNGHHDDSNPKVNGVHNSEYIEADFTERYTVYSQDEQKYENVLKQHKITTEKRVPKLGVMLVGLGGNNGSTLVAGVLANKQGLSWETKNGTQQANFFGSFTQSATAHVGFKIDEKSGSLADVHKPVKEILPMVNPCDFEITGWDISQMNLYEAARRSKVLEPDLLRQLKAQLENIKPLPAALNQDYIASNQADRADNILTGTNQEIVNKLREDIQQMKRRTDKVIILWTANTEQYYLPEIATVDDLADKIKNNDPLPASVLYCIAAIEEQVIYLNGSPQNTFHPGVVEYARQNGGLLAGSDFKSGQTRFKTMMSDFLIGAGLRLSSVVSYNHLGNNDGKNLSEDKCFQSKKISKGGVLDDAIASNSILYPDGHASIDHEVVIKYVPFVGDSKRALDEYTSQIFMGGTNTISSYNICEDSLLAVPIMIDMLVLGELLTRIKIDGNGLGPVLSYLSFFFKAPITNHSEYVVNSFSRQRHTLINFLKAAAGISPDDQTLIGFGY
ncbi:UNKNOWN [Stylonychia lemnae]|uniref:inositol-3-phosphate synthase n=1 Tax=Stylonychia lemnae TaxID=5949 RepID=A0A077ZTN9_STYLE|nr:UNKNOWN [Stylonychia lemnae]|eukprot:CDW73283.1 UNKNOWN [Stylonychia lemnae]